MRISIEMLPYKIHCSRLIAGPGIQEVAQSEGSLPRFIIRLLFSIPALLSPITLSLAFLTLGVPSDGCAQSPASLMASSGSPNPAAAASSEARPNEVSPDATLSQPGRQISLPDVPPLPSGKTTLIGGTIHTVDHIRDVLLLDVFGGGRTPILFDERTRVFQGEEKVSLDDLKNGERASVDTTLDGTHIFARNIRVTTVSVSGQGDGQIVAFDRASGNLTLRDLLAPEPVTMRLAPGASILQADRAATPAQLLPGTLVRVIFDPAKGGQSKHTPPLVRQVSILALPGATFIFSGHVEYLDLRRDLLALVDPRDNKSYEVHIDPKAHAMLLDVKEGSDVSVQATFDGKRYQAGAVTINSASGKQAAGAEEQNH
jgi:hypothetical protein